LLVRPMRKTAELEEGREKRGNKAVDGLGGGREGEPAPWAGVPMDIMRKVTPSPSRPVVLAYD